MLCITEYGKILQIVFCKRVKRGTDGIRIVNIVVVIVARSIKIVRIVGIVIVAGTQPAILIKVIALKARFHRTLLNCKKLFIRLGPSSVR